MRKLYAALSAAALAGLLALSAGALYIAEDLPGFVEFSVYPIETTWTPDGVFTEGEYHVIDYDRSWISANADVDADAQAGKDLDFTIAMSWDDTYIYTYVQHVDTNGYSSSFAGEPYNMWIENMLQLNFADGDAAGENMYSAEMTWYPDTGDFGVYSWYDYLQSGWLPGAETDFVVTVGEDDNGADLVTYESRIRFDAFSETAPQVKARYSVCPLISWGSEGAVIHTQLGSGSTDQKQAWEFANFTLLNGYPEQTDTYWPEAQSAFQKLDLEVQYAETEWNPDGQMSEGEYFLIEEKTDWNSASASDAATLETAKNLDYTLGMSWDKDYIYTYMEFIDPDGHVNADTAENIWNNGGLQIGMACGDRSGSYYLEYNIAESSEDGELMSYQYSANEGGTYDPTGNFDVFVETLEDNTSRVIYEVRTPHSAYMDWTVSNDTVISAAYVLCWGNNAIAHTQLSSGISGPLGKDAAYFADFVLTGAPYYIHEEDAGEIAFTVEQATAEWAADGSYTAGEYFDIAVQDTWISAFSSDPTQTAAVKAMDFDLAMSWDADYLYSYVKFTAPEGYQATPAAEPWNMWGYTCLQMNAADVDCTGENRLEYGMATNTDGDMISTVWADYLSAAYDPEGDYGVFVDGDTVVYELRTPFTAFSGNLSTDGNQYGVCYMLSSSLDTGNLRHTQLASGCSGEPGKDASRFAVITLNGEEIDRSVAWDFAEATGTLTVSGNNPIVGYETADDQPWAEVRDQIKAIVIEGSVGCIGTNAFLDCTNAETITIGEGVTEIRIYAFENCAAVKTIHIPKSVTSIADGAFKRCYSLESFTVDAENAAYTAQDGVLYTKDMTNLMRYPHAKTGTSFTVPETVIVLRAAAMEELTYLTSVTLPENLEAIETWCFAGTKGLTEIHIPARLEYLNNYAFGGCSNLTDAYFYGNKPWVYFADDAFADTAETFTIHYYAGKEGWDTVTGYNMEVMTVKGDITGDGTTDNNDLALLQQYYSGYPTTINTSAADIDGENGLTRKDVMILARYLAGWVGYDKYFS